MVTWPVVWNDPPFEAAIVYGPSTIPQIGLVA